MFKSADEFKRFVQELGFQEPPDLLKRELDEGAEVRRTMAYAVVSSLPPSLDQTRGTIAIREMHEELRQLLLFGFVGPALICCGSFLEHVLEDAIMFHDKTKLGRQLTTAEERRIESGNLEDAISAARNRGILTKDEVKKLKRFVDQWRDPYHHGALGSITSGVRIAGVKMVNLRTGETKAGELLTEEEARPVRHFTKSAKDAHYAIPVFRELDKTLQTIWDRQGR